MFIHIIRRVQDVTQDYFLSEVHLGSIKIFPSPRRLPYRDKRTHSALLLTNSWKENKSIIVFP